VHLIFRRLLILFRRSSSQEKLFIGAIARIIGKKPININLFYLATQHSSVAKSNPEGFRESNERLEYLGDAILGAVIAEFLFKKYPYKDEGFLTDIRARMVNRETLNNLARKIGVADIVEYHQSGRSIVGFKSLYGDTLEALIGAVYLDRGYGFSRRFILRKLIEPHLDIDDIVKNNPNYKSKIIEWAHRENKEVKFEILEVKGSKHNREFIAQVMVDNKPLGKGNGFSKKKAEQDAAQKTCEILKLE
jgi:ribonuclease-3